MKERIHVPVLWKQVLDEISPQSGDTVVDATLGSGGYTRSLCERVTPNGVMIAFDRDKKAIDDFLKKKSLGVFPEMSGMTDEKNLFLIHANYSDIDIELSERNIFSVDGIVADLGISSDQLLDSEKGLSFLGEHPLDMRLDTQESVPTAYDIVNTWDEDSLARMFWKNSQEKHAHTIAQKIIEKRKKSLIRTTKDLSDIIESEIFRKHTKIHPATKVFQALRMEVNREEYHLKIFLEKAIRLLRVGARLAVVSFHSGEDRLVKECFRVHARGCICPSSFPLCRCNQKPQVQLVQKKPICPSEEEIRINPRSRSAKLRVVEKIYE